MKTIRFILAVGAVLFTAVSAAHAVQIDWQGSDCLTIDSTFHVCKPDHKWDTQKTKQENRPIKWVYHEVGANPIIWLRYDDAAGKTAHDYAKFVRQDLESRGVVIQSVKNKVLNGRNVSIITGVKSDTNLKYMVGVWRNQAKGFNLECSASTDNFGKYEWHCMKAIESVKIVSETR
ncbi:MAG: hypothetical protein HYU99_07220 [Deltaproteobacteria bacterium]|nr:hypothetical protein [Deltaproteobacteria bacterium]